LQQNPLRGAFQRATIQRALFKFQSVVKYKYSDRAISRCRFTPTRVTTANFIDICGNVHGTWPLQAERNHVHSRQPWRSTVVMHKVGWNVNV